MTEIEAAYGKWRADNATGVTGIEVWKAGAEWALEEILNALRRDYGRINEGAHEILNVAMEKIRALKDKEQEK